MDEQTQAQDDQLRANARDEQDLTLPVDEVSVTESSDNFAQSVNADEKPAQITQALGNNYKSGIEALLFVSDKPILLEQFKTVFPELKPADIAQFVKDLQDEYVNRNSGMVIVDIAQGWQMLSNSHAAGYIREFYKTKTKEKLSRPSLETLAIIAYKQPVSRGEMEIIRGVNCDGTVAHLLNKGLIEIVGRKEVAGRPFIYGTTKSFLEYFGLRSLEDLPKLENLPQLSELESEGKIINADTVEVKEFKTQEQVAESTAQEATQESSGQARLMQEAAKDNAEG